MKYQDPKKEGVQHWDLGWGTIWEEDQQDTHSVGVAHVLDNKEIKEGTVSYKEYTKRLGWTIIMVVELECFAHRF